MYRACRLAPTISSHQDTFPEGLLGADVGNDQARPPRTQQNSVRQPLAVISRVVRLMLAQDDEIGVARAGIESCRHTPFHISPFRHEPGIAGCRVEHGLGFVPGFEKGFLKHIAGVPENWFDGIHHQIGEGPHDIYPGQAGVMVLGELNRGVKPFFTGLAVVDVDDEIFDGHLQCLHAVKRS